MTEHQTVQHALNEWADLATNALQWFRNIKAGISTAEQAFDNVFAQYERIKPLSKEALATAQPISRCCRCNGDGFISGDYPDLPDEPCQICNAGAPSGAERVRAAGQPSSPMIDSAAFQNTDDAEIVTVLAAVRHCANSWDGGARLLGNVRARDISRACDYAIKALAATPAAPCDVAEIVREAKDIVIMAQAMMEKRITVDPYLACRMVSHLTKCAEALSRSSAANVDADMAHGALHAIHEFHENASLPVNNQPETTP